MTPEQYEKMAVWTESDPREAGRKLHADEQLVRLLHAGIGLATEAGEFLDRLKKVIYYRPFGDSPTEADLVNLQEEMGDLLWYIAIATNSINIRLAGLGAHTTCKTITQIMQQNIDKLRVRYKNRFDSIEAQNRNLTREQEALEQ